MTLNFYDFLNHLQFFDVVFTVVLMRMKSILCMSFLSTLGSPEIGFLHFYCVFNNTHEYS